MKLQVQTLSLSAKPLAATILALGLLPSVVHAQLMPIDRVKITDNELTCAQMFAEANAMDKAIADAKAMQAQGANTATVGSAGNVAAQVAGRTGLFGQLGGITGALFGQAATQAAASAAQQTGQATAQQAAEHERQASEIGRAHV